MRSEAEFLGHALTKLRLGAPYSVAAVFVAEVTPSDMDGVRWRTFVTDGESTGFVDAEVSTSTGGRAGLEVPTTHIERQVEYAAGRLPRESRLEELLAASPIAIPL